jgi:putative sterol carrier protein
MYDGFTNVMKKHGDKMVSNLNKVVAYELTDIDKKIVLDMKNHEKGQVYMHNPDAPGTKPDLTLKMDRQTFDDICDGKIGGFKGVVQGRIKFKGSLNDLKNFDSRIVKTYFGPDLRPKDVPIR